MRLERQFEAERRRDMGGFNERADEKPLTTERLTRRTAVGLFSARFPATISPNPSHLPSRPHTQSCFKDVQEQQSSLSSLFNK